MNFLRHLALQGGKKNLMTARVSMLLKSHASLTCFRACFLPGWAKDLSAPQYLRTNSDLYHVHHKLIGFYKRDEKCLQRGTNWVFKWSSLRFVCKGLIWSIYIWKPHNKMVGVKRITIRKDTHNWSEKFFKTCSNASTYYQIVMILKIKFHA